MSHHLTAKEVERAVVSYLTFKPGLTEPDEWTLPIGDYVQPDDAVEIRARKALWDSPKGTVLTLVLEFLDKNGEVCGTLNGGFPCPGFPWC